MVKYSQLMVISVLVAVLVISIPIQSSFAETGFTNVKKATGVIMMFCANETFLLQDCNQRYDGIGWTDRINVLIYAPGWNEDSDKTEQIGTTLNPINVYTDAARVDKVEFSETGPDTGVFMGVVKLTGESQYIVHNTFKTTVKTPGMTMDMDNPMMGGPISSYDRAVMIATTPQDGRVTVSWESNEDVVVMKSAHYGWQIGQVEFDKDAYDVNEKVTFFMRDADLWKHHREFFTNYVKVYSDSDRSGIHVGVQFTKAMEHASSVIESATIHLTEPAASSLTKYTPNGEWKTYFWTEPGGVLGINQDYNLNLMVHDGLTDIHEMGLSYNMDVYLNGELIESRTDRYAGDGQAIESMRFDERGSAKIVFTDVFGRGNEVNFSFQVAPEAIIEQVVPRHDSFERGNVPEFMEGYEHPHYINYLPGSFIMTTDDSSQSENKLRVSDGDTIYVEYEDITLPDPYHTSDTLEIVARAVVLDTGFVQPPNSSDTEIFVGTPRINNSPDIILDEDGYPILDTSFEDVNIPSWIKKNAAWWSDGKLNDHDFAKGVEYLVQQNIITVPTTEVTIDEQNETVTSIPTWVKNNAAWWSNGQLTDVEFANGIQYLVSTGLIKV